jgi:hypothetical protein
VVSYFIHFPLTYDVKHFSDAYLCTSSFGEVSIKVFDPFFLIWLVVFLLSFKSSLHILNNTSLSALPFANIFSESVVCLYILWEVSFAEQRFKILILYNDIKF